MVSRRKKASPSFFGGWIGGRDLSQEFLAPCYSPVFSLNPLSLLALTSRVWPHSGENTAMLMIGSICFLSHLIQPLIAGVVRCSYFQGFPYTN